jgi:predicted Zn-dependent protease
MRKILFLVFLGCLLYIAQAVHLDAQVPWGIQNHFDDALSRMDDAFARQEATEEDAYYLGRAVAANILANYKPYTQKPELTSYLNRICQTIVINSAYPVNFNGYRVIILDSPEFNAFASPGGHIFITRGIVEAAVSEDMLAAIIAHELAHIMLNHSISIIDDIRLLDDMSAIADRAASFAGNSESARRLLYFRNSVDTVINALFINGYSRDQEFEADMGAVVLLAASGYSPSALVEMLKLLTRVQGSQMGGFNTTHPKPSERIINAEGWIKQYRIPDTSSYRIPRFNNK